MTNTNELNDELTPEEQAKFDKEVQKRLDEKRGVFEYADPSPMNGAKDKPRPRNPEEIGHQMYERLKKKGLI